MTGGRETPTAWNGYGVGAVEGQSVLIWTYRFGERLTFLPGWHLLPPPVPGETWAAHWDRVISEHPLIRDILGRGALMPNNLKLPRMGGVRPAERTLAWWEKTYLPFREFQENEPRRQALEHYLKLIVRRLEVELFDRLKADDLVVKGRRMDVSTSLVEAVEADLWRNHFMVLHPHHRGDGWFGPEGWQGHAAPPPSLQSYCDLTLWPAETETAKPKLKTKQGLLTDALVLLHREGVFNVLSRAVPVDVLHKTVGEKAGVNVHKPTFERALRDARKRLANT